MSLLAALRPEGWPGVDDAVVRHVASAAGRAPRQLVPGPQGDLLLFAFLCGGLVAGFVVGYCYRALFTEPPRLP